MVLDLLAIKTPRYIPVVMIRQGDTGGGSQWNALIGRAKQDIKIDVAANDCPCVETSQPGKVFPGIEPAGIEEIRAAAS